MMNIVGGASASKARKTKKEATDGVLNEDEDC
jgi:hypothetical protein